MFTPIVFLLIDNAPVKPVFTLLDMIPHALLKNFLTKFIVKIESRNTKVIARQYSFAWMLLVIKI